MTADAVRDAAGGVAGAVADDGANETTVAVIAERVARDYLGLRPGERFAIVVDDRTDAEIPRELARAALAWARIRSSCLSRRGHGAAPNRRPRPLRRWPPPMSSCAPPARPCTTRGQGGGAASRRTRRLQRPVPGRRLAGRRDDRGLLRPSGHVPSGWPRCGGARARSASPPPRARTCGRRRGPRADGLADRDLPQPGRGLGAARRRGLAAAARGHVRGHRRVGAGRLGPGALEARCASRSGRGGRSRSRAARRPTACAPSSKRVRDADNIGEIGIGLNPAARGSATRSPRPRRRSGPSHIALGDSANEYGGLVECDVHLDGLVMEPTIEFDGVPVVVAGRHVYDRAMTVEEPPARASPPPIQAPAPGRSSSGCALSRAPGREPAVPKHHSSSRRPPARPSSIPTATGSSTSQRASPPPPSVTAIRLSSPRSVDQAGRADSRGVVLDQRGRAIGFEEALLGIAPAGLDRVLLGLSGIGRERHRAEARPDCDWPPRGDRFLWRLLRSRQRRLGLNGKAAVRAQAGREAAPSSFPTRIPIAGRRAERGGRPRRARTRPARSRNPRPGSARSRRSWSSRSRATAVSSFRRRVPPRPSGVVRPPRSRPHLRRDPVRVRSHRTDVGRRALRRRARPHDRRQGDRRRDGRFCRRRTRPVHESLGARVHTSTFMGNAINLAAGRAAIGVFRQERLAERSAALGDTLIQRLKSALADEPHVGEVRGLGLFAGIEIVVDRTSRTPDPRSERGDPPGGLRARRPARLGRSSRERHQDLPATDDRGTAARRRTRASRSTPSRGPDDPDQDPVIHGGELHRRPWSPAASGDHAREPRSGDGRPRRGRAASGVEDVGGRSPPPGRRSIRGRWPATSGRERAAILFELARLLREEAEPLSRLVATEMGKPIRYVRERELEPAIDRILFYASAARMIRGEVTASAPSHLLNFILKEPVGVCGLITPWNDPVDLPLRKIGAAIATGCTFVLKPASDAPASSMAIFGLLDRIQALPHGVANGVVGEGGVVGEALATDPRVDKISFTGSSEVGRRPDGARCADVQARLARGRRQGAGHRLPRRQPREGDGRGLGRDLPVRRSVVHRRKPAAHRALDPRPLHRRASSSAPKRSGSARRSTRTPRSGRWSRAASSIAC